MSREECSVMGDREEMYSKLEQDLISQVENIISDFRVTFVTVTLFSCR